MAVNLEQFVQSLHDSGLMTPEQTGAFLDGLPPEEKPQSAEELARLLHWRKRLTAFQAQSVYQGKVQGLVLGNYVVLDRIGQGGMGQVFMAEHRRMRRIVALKVLPRGLAESSGGLERFQREVEAAAQLAHPNIVTAYDAGEAGGAPFLVMEYVEGSDLASLVAKEGPLAEGRALDCILQAARGLEYAHGRKMIHRDIKPSNLLVDGQGVVKILDMGLARFRKEGEAHEADRSASLTETGQVMGTIDYMAPEQALDFRRADQRSDIYSLGCTLFYLLTGRAVYGGESLMARLVAHQEAAVPSLCEIRPELTPELDAAFRRMVSKSPEQRHQSAAELIAELEPLCGDRTAPAGSERAGRPPWWRDGKKLAAAGAGGVVLIALGVWAIVRDKSGREVARVSVPEGGSVTVASTQSPAQRPGTPAASRSAGLLPWRLPPGSPPPAVAPFDEKTAEEHQAAWAKHLKVAVETENSIGIRLALIPPGEFDMGATDAQLAECLQQAKAMDFPEWRIEHVRSESPQHRVRITRPFWLSRCEITRGQFRRFVDQHGYKTDAQRNGKGGYRFVPNEFKQDPRFVWNSSLNLDQTDEHPVVNVSWNDAAAFCEWLSQKDGTTVRLPTEAQWEYACRAGTTTMWHSGDDAEAAKEHGWVEPAFGMKTHPVGRKLPKPWGLYDMHGNVWEWCHDWWATRYYGLSALDDPPGPAAGSGRVHRGSCWLGSALDGRASIRNYNDPGHNTDGLGFRIAVEIPPAP